MGDSGDVICETLLILLAYNMIDGIFLTICWLKFLTMKILNYPINLVSRMKQTNTLSDTLNIPYGFRKLCFKQHNMTFQSMLK